MGCGASASKSTVVEAIRPDYFKKLSKEGKDHFLWCEKERTNDGLYQGKQTINTLLILILLMQVRRLLNREPTAVI